MPKKYSSLAIAGFVFSLLFFIPFFSIIGIICGIAALVGISKDKKLKGKGLAIAAVIIGAAVMIIQILIVILIIKFFAGFAHVVENPSEGVKKCLGQSPGLIRDTCIFTAVYSAASSNSIDSIDKNVCNDNVVSLETKSYCNAVLTGDRGHCQQISDLKSRTKCIEIVKEAYKK